ncbi:metal homeostatis protein bsd2 [Sporothrix schenckii 1099-18]|uniref:Metal homeostatis protein bsd2 n=1 Tax=Sporothrix schenckii 1099-18 TaxID=1397361 RepID=A0A0F2MCX5_SPOSC|nr:metal homeostatis protein bsd2 [Sporothrix schenckii 1099-18]KJR87538.1 metal homeostatis protein bsd2 [Sporothrix schenckii 1099-18]
MSARYERVHAQEDDYDYDDHDDHDDDRTPRHDNSLFSPNPTIPNSPPPSFRSRTSSQAPTITSGGRRHGTASIHTTHSVVDPALVDAFGDDNDDNSDDDDGADADDRQRLMRSRDALRPMRAPAWMTRSGAAATETEESDSNAAPTPSTSTPSPAPAPTRRPAPASGTTPTPTTGRVYGGGIQSDGVFSNLTARPEPGEEKDELPPSKTYEQAAADAAPPYWETTILAPHLGGPDDVYVDGMPVGSVFSFAWNGMISMSFQIVGFLLTYLLHSTHAAKNGSRAGLGITLIQYGFYVKGSGDSGGGGSGMDAAGAAAAKSSDGYAAPPDPNAHNFDPSTVGTGDVSGGGSGGIGASLSDIASSEWAAYALMIVGWLILIKSVSDFMRARRHEQLVLQSPDRGLGVAVIAEGENPERVV